MKKFSLVITIFLLHFAASLAQQVIEGEVRNADTKEPIAGASIRITGTQKGTYSSGAGKFRLPLPEGNNVLKITSIGFKEKSLTVTASDKTLIITLSPSAISTAGVTVTAGLDADQIVSRTIARIKKYSENLNTYEGLLYTKFIFQADKGNGSASGDDKSVTVGFTLGGDDKDTSSSTRNIIMESFSKAYFEKGKGSRFSIIQRRQTANIPAGANTLALGNFFNFFEKIIRLPGVELTSPLGDDALNSYNFSIDSKTTIGDKEVYVIGIEPASRLFPAFKGTMKILADTYDPLEISVRPSQNTAIPTVKNLVFTQKFEKLSDDIWQPAYLQVQGASFVEVLKGFVEISLDFSIISIYNDFQFNKAIPDSIFGDGNRIITVAPMADSARPEFWENNSLSALSLEEKEIYRTIDSAEKAKVQDSVQQNSLFSFDFLPILEFNRVSSIMTGAVIEPSYGPVALKLRGLYSFGQKKPYGNAGLRVTFFEAEGFKTNITGNIFSEIATASTDKGIPMFINTAFAALFHEDYYDYFQRDGWKTGLSASWRDFSAGVNFENSRQFALANTTSRSIFKKGGFRQNPAALEGNYNIFSATAGRGDPEQILSFTSGSNVEFDAKLLAEFGKETTRNLSFQLFEALAHFSFPTFPIGGYSPMFLKIGAYGGLGSDDLPQQFRFRMRSSTVLAGGFGVFISAPVAVYGGTKYYAFSAEHNFSDFFWRAIGLPTYQGRGIDLSIGGASGQFFQTTPSSYISTNDQWYSEVGFGLSRIPTFVSNVIFLRTDFRWGVGALGNGNFGMTIGASLPF
ncbi:MAG: DUF5686 family protein [Bacteroidota bacterium]